MTSLASNITRIALKMAHFGAVKIVTGALLLGTSALLISTATHHSAEGQPTLSWTGEANFISSGVYPERAPSGTNFEFRVKYTSPGDLPPDYVRLYLDADDDGSFGEEEIHDMKISRSSADDGESSFMAHKDIVLRKAGDGRIKYFFCACDGARDAVGEATAENTLTVLNNPPTLDWPMEPDFYLDGSKSTDGRFEFKVSYHDLDNESPHSIEVWIDADGSGDYGSGEKHPLSQVASDDDDFTDGKAYTHSQALRAGGRSLRYRFYASDGLEDATGDPTREMLLPSGEGAPSNQVSTPSYSQAGGAPYIYNPTGGGYDDEDADSPPDIPSDDGGGDDEDDGDDDEDEPQPQPQYQLSAGTSSASLFGIDSIAISMPYTGDADGDSTFTVRYKLSSSDAWSDWGTNPKTHVASPFTDSITGLTTGESYDVRLEYNDPDGVTGANPQDFYGIMIPPVEPAAPTIGAATALSSGSVRWAFADNASDETGFKVHDASHQVVASAAVADLAYLDEGGLSANTLYTRHVHAYNGAGDSGPSAEAQALTLALAPDVAAGKATSTWYQTPDVVFTNQAGFGAGSLEYYRYAFDQSPTHTFVGTETQWSSGTLTVSAAASGSWYLHVRSYNAGGQPAGSLDLGPYCYDQAAPQVSAFQATTPSTSLDVPITLLGATDDVGVTGYLVTQSSEAPLASDPGWSGQAPASHHVAADGAYTLYPWARDASGRVSPVYGSPQGVVVDTTAPAVSQTLPQDGQTGVALDGQVSIEFSEDVDCATVSTQSVTISGGGWALVGCSEDEAVFATSSQTGLSAYTVTVAGSVEDAAGNPMGAPYQFTYTTAQTAPAAPTIGAATALSSGSVRWAFADNASDETGFKVHDASHQVVASAAVADLAYLDEGGLSANTLYTRHVHAYNGAGDSGPSAEAQALTLALAPDVAAGKATSTWYQTPDVVFTNQAGFGAGSLEYYRYAFDQSPTHTFVGTETQWSSGTLTVSAAASGSWYLHVRSYNAGGQPAGSLDLGPYCYDQAAPQVSAFQATTPSTSLDVPITLLGATDDVGVTGYLVTQSSEAPLASDPGWSGQAPASHHVAADGAYTLYPWARDASGRVSPVYGSPQGVVVDTTAPAVSQTLPQDGQTGVALDGQVSIEFSEDVDCATVSTQSVTISGGGWALVGCSEDEAVFQASGQSNSTTYTVTVTTAVEDAAGNPMGAPYQFTYTTAAAPGGEITVCASGCDFTTIQSAISDAGTTSGETVLVYAGTYSENINFNGKNITVTSASGAASTAIQGSGANSPVVTFANAETSSAALDGFTIDNQAAANSATRGVSISGTATPTISDCVIKGNAMSSGTGAGVYIAGSGSATITSTTIGVSGSPNTAGSYGGGVYATGTGPALTISGSTISYNTCANGGAGIYLTSKNATTQISATTVSNNTSPQTGGGIFSNASPLQISGSTISSNAINNTGMNGGGMYLSGAAAVATISDTAFEGNRSNAAGGGAIYMSGGADVTMTGGSMTSNVAGATSGGAVFATGAGTTLEISGAEIRG
ncbi:MAG: Ig-like domain-containing protein, partial [Pseudomonadota bacterium]